MASSSSVSSSRSNTSDKHVVIEISELVDSVEKKLSAVRGRQSQSCSIFKVHDKFRGVNVSAYTPEMVSIGPIHLNAYPQMQEQKLRYVNDLVSRSIGPIHLNAYPQMQEQKLRYVNDLVSRSKLNLKECLESILRIEGDVRDSYPDTIIRDLNSAAFVESMLIDGLFIIELLYKKAKNEINGGDLILNNRTARASILHDMILLENQIPMLVLSCLFDMVSRNETFPHTLDQLALIFFDSLMERKKEDLNVQFRITSCKHLLDLFGRSFYDFGQQEQENSSEENQEPKQFNPIPSATELTRAGVEFIRNDDAKSFLDIKFSDGKMSIPTIKIQDHTDCFLRNLIAFEAFDDKHGMRMTSYAFLMKSLINSPDDVAILRSRDIIANLLGSDEDVSSLFNKLCAEVTIANFHYHDLCVEVNKHASTCWHQNLATLRRNYFNTPWAGIAVGSAGILLLCTVASTILTGLSYFAPKH